jgi:cyanophycinase-like exopeptidase
MPVQRVGGNGWLVLVGGGEFTFGETVDADRAWMSKVGDGPVAFLPTASGSTEYGDFFTAYLKEGFDRAVDVVPIYRRRDARRGRNLGRLDAAAAIYLGGGVTDHLLEAVAEEPALEHLGTKLAGGGVIVAIAAAAQAFGVAARSIFGGSMAAGFGWLRGGVIEPNFDPGHDRRLRELLRAPGASWGLGIPAGSAVLLGPDERVETVGTVFKVEGADGDLAVLAPTAP